MPQVTCLVVKKEQKAIGVIQSLCSVYSLLCFRVSKAAPLPVHCAFSCHLGWTPKPTPLFDQEAPVCNRLCSQSHRQTWSAQTKATKTNTTTTRKSDVVKVELKMSCPASPPKPAPPLIPDLNKWHHHSPHCSFLFSRGCS